MLSVIKPACARFKDKWKIRQHSKINPFIAEEGLDLVLYFWGIGMTLL